MKQKLLIGFTAVALSLAHMAHADFTFYSGANNCDEIPGNWAGSGKATNWLIGECAYNGSGTLGELDTNGSFDIEVSADKSSGSFVCPDHNTTKLKGVCVNGKVTIKTEYGNLSGIFSKTSGSAKGTLSVSPGMDVDVSIQFKRVG
ncbi:MULTISPECIES: hypothetical protein [Legionella]|mgnify:CR=1 FL=1|uniref:Uncharacterized protein n=1 Tax=Legionella steelei TaxID=947033 RepID=A0A0W0ZDV4_9GAMM|nr:MULTISPECIES: hypothetical protein [Legionella]KTD67241.1 hypothetical protein Lste_3447 [Legionella steelei]MBN9228784.1 hypothetical protein [Legionella steelei]OJW16232.1 MAG: hypothetical protein BGO44_07040 [Legionella sp. 39-23]